MSVSVLFSGAPVEAAPPPPPPPPVELDQFWIEMAGAAIYAKWKQQNPGELSRLRTYAADGAKPLMLTAFGRSLVEVVEAQRQLGDPTIQIP